MKRKRKVYPKIQVIVDGAELPADQYRLAIPGRGLLRPRKPAVQKLRCYRVECCDSVMILAHLNRSMAKWVVIDSAIEGGHTREVVFRSVRVTCMGLCPGRAFCGTHVNGGGCV